MGVRGRKPTLDPEVSRALARAATVAPIERPAPPSELSDEAAEEWRAITERLPADWFPRETHAMLAQYVRHIVSARRVAELIAGYDSSTDDFDLGTYDKMLAMQDREGRAMSSLATRLRLTQQSTVSAKVKKPSLIKKPWLDHDEPDA